MSSQINHCTVYCCTIIFLRICKNSFMFLFSYKYGITQYLSILEIISDCSPLMRTVTRLPKNLQTPTVSFFWTSDTEFSTFYIQQKQSTRTGEHICTPIPGKQKQSIHTEHRCTPIPGKQEQLTHTGEHRCTPILGKQEQGHYILTATLL